MTVPVYDFIPVSKTKNLSTGSPNKSRQLIKDHLIKVSAKSKPQAKCDHIGVDPNLLNKEAIANFTQYESIYASVSILELAAGIDDVQILKLLYQAGNQEKTKIVRSSFPFEPVPVLKKGSLIAYRS